TRVGSIMGTPLYMAPEQFRGESTGSQSDIYSLGVIAYRMLAGETPSGSSLEELSRFHDTLKSPGSLRGKNRKVSRRIASVVERALAPAPADRPRSAAAFASELRVAAEGSGKLLREAISLYSERFPIFLRISLLAYAPLIAMVAVLFLSD